MHAMCAKAKTILFIECFVLRMRFTREGKGEEGGEGISDKTGAKCLWNEL